ncbi:hypothetical protein CYY_003276 [Polysphondylium violaceum]|uniref:Phytanoyl-CoA dioxygenase n=1 Tax=Polysphondylium violaceum TaxID=133409 RepID=A0A8J4Q002_9MYCE|nr:hypothetical protein CYY_003276 [Polysphondylium violaceum]
MKLTKEQYDQYEEQGFLVLPNFVSPESVDGLRDEMKRLIDELDTSSLIKTVFTSDEQARKTNQYFLESGDKISFFFETAALNDKDEICVDKQVAFNKVGHALHDLNPVFEKFSYQDAIKDVMRPLYKKPLSVQSMYIFKNPKIGGEVSIHQDSTFLHTTPLTTHALWFAFEDANVVNGCLRGLPGSHKNGIYKRFKRNPDGTCTFDVVNENEPTYDKKDFIPLECKKGSAILLHGSAVHYSEPNTSGISRHAYTLHFIEGDGSALYEEDNWLQRPNPNLPFREL